jgi:para-aminobenzoate synthetase / 4-amino-4-deoxychorismate lyase
MDASPVCFLFDNQRAAPGTAGSLLFERPATRITAWSSTEVTSALAQVEAERARGRHVCGTIAYEAGAFGSGRSRAVSARLHGDAARIDGLALVDFYAFEHALSMTAADVTEWLARRCAMAPRAAVHGVSWTETRDAYRAKIATIKSHIQSGDTYQVNFTFKCKFGLEGPALALYRNLRSRQRVEHGAYVRLPDREILSFSPELFVRRQGEMLTCKPMKGTAPRGTSDEEDEQIVARLKADPKTLSENVMIVDLIRSDLGRIARVGSVRVEGLFDVETFESVHQMVSTVRGEVDAGVTLVDVMASVFPCGSVTGAPKVRTMEIIDGLESEMRGIYTGALGWIAPSGDFTFSVPIRTLVVRGGRGEMGVGSGIVHESDADAELDECFVKASFLTRSNEALRLVETLRFDATSRRLVHIDAHLRRMQTSAACFGFAFAPARVRAAVDHAVAPHASSPCKVRIVLSIDGDVEVSVEPLARLETPRGTKPWVTVSPKPIDSTSCFRRHKTTARELYDEAYAACVAAGGYDVLFLNERGELAEASRHNVFLEKGGALLTPPVEAGALPGIERQRVLDDPQTQASEATLSLEDVRAADRIWLSNSVRGLVEVVLAHEAGTVRRTVVAAPTCST